MSDFRSFDRRKNRKRRVVIGLYKKTKAKIQDSLDRYFADLGPKTLKGRLTSYCF